MEFIFEIIFQFLGELLLQLIFEFLVELGVHSLADTLKRPKNAVLSTIGFVLWGGDGRRDQSVDFPEIGDHQHCLA